MSESKEGIKLLNDANEFKKKHSKNNLASTGLELFFEFDSLSKIEKLRVYDRKFFTKKLIELFDAHIESVILYDILSDNKTEFSLEDWIKIKNELQKHNSK